MIPTISILRDEDHGPYVVYDIWGHRLTALPSAPGLYVLRFLDGTTKKVSR